MDQHTARVAKIHRDGLLEPAQVHQAAGILMSRLGVSSFEAIAWMRELSTITGLALLEVAIDIIAAESCSSRADRGTPRGVGELG